MIIRFRYFDWVIFGGLVLLMGMSLVTLASIGGSFFQRQLLWYVIGFCIFFCASQIEWRWLLEKSWFRIGFFIIVILLLLYANFQSTTIRGTRSWITIGNFQFEPSEFAKLLVIFLLAHFFSRRHIAVSRVKNIFLSCVYTMIPGGLVLMHPDFGSAAVIIGIWVGFLFMSGINKKRLMIGVLIFIVLATVMWIGFLKPYQKDRVTSFIFPDKDPLGANYNVIQSKIAIGSSGFFGKGFGGGTQTHLHFLPEAETDFLFAAFVEEWGLFGGTLLLLTFGIIFFRVIYGGLSARDNEARFIIIGGGLFLIIHFVINIGSNLGLTPVAGVTLPFFSYGGSNLLTTSLLLGIIEHIKLESSR